MLGYMSRLIPERRLNKHGVLVTRWVASPSENPAEPRIPAPTAPVFNVARSKVASLFKLSRLASMGFDIQGFDPGAVQAVEWVLQKAGEDGTLWQAQRIVIKAFDDVRDNLAAPAFMDDAGPLATFNNLAVFAGAVMHRDAQRFDVRELAGGLDMFPGVSDFLFDATEEQRVQAVALVTVAAFFEQPVVVWQSGAVSLRSEPLRALIMEHPDDAERIARVIRDRNTDDTGAIREVLWHEQQALSGGVL